MKPIKGVLALVILIISGCNIEAPSSPPVGKIVGAEGAKAYDALSTGEKAAAGALRVWFEHASVGGNIMDGVDVLTSQGLTLERIGMSAGAPLDTDQSAVITSWFSTHRGIYDNMRGNPGLSEKIRYFTEDLPLLAQVLDVALMKFCYIDDEADAGTTGVEAYIQAMETLQAAYPQVALVYVTMPVKTSGSTPATLFNQALRTHCRNNNLWLYDLADVESRLEDGSTLLVNGEEALRTDLAVNSSGDDHLNSAGQEKGAKALMTLLAELAKTR